MNGVFSSLFSIHAVAVDPPFAEHTVRSSAFVILQQFKDSAKPRTRLIETFSFYYGVYAPQRYGRLAKRFLNIRKKNGTRLWVFELGLTWLRCLPEVQYGRLSIREHDHRRRQPFILTAHFGPSALSEGIQQFQVSRHAAERRKRNVRLFNAHTTSLKKYNFFS